MEPKVARPFTSLPVVGVVPTQEPHSGQHSGTGGAVVVVPASLVVGIPIRATDLHTYLARIGDEPPDVDLPPPIAGSSSSSVYVPAGSI